MLTEVHDNYSGSATTINQHTDNTQLTHMQRCSEEVCGWFLVKKGWQGNKVLHELW